jgi:hypothetical protein
MKQTGRKSEHAHIRPALAAVAAILCLGLLSAATASAAFEQAGCFAGSCVPVANKEFPEEAQLSRVGGMAVNYTGAGGVPAGTVYAATQPSGTTGTRVAMFEPQAGGLKFVEGWEMSQLGKSRIPCGPAGELPSGETVHPSCPLLEPGPDQGVDIDVDQSTGNLYIWGQYRDETLAPVWKVIVYGADGSEEIARFGELEPHQSVSESPAKIHHSQYSGAIAVNGTGEVFLSDQQPPPEYRRLMVFRPQSPGDYAHYAYAGEVLAHGGGEGIGTTGPVTDAAGNIYVGGGVGSETIAMYAPQAPAPFPAPEAEPVCSFEYPKSGIAGVTVNPQTGEPYFFSYKKPKLVRRLGPCNPETGKFEVDGVEEIGTIEEPKPERGDLWAMAFDPLRQLSPGRPAGVLYAGTPGAVPEIGKGEPGQTALGYIFTGAAENPPAVEAESASHVTATTAQLHAKVNPKGFKTSYAFQYETLAAYEANEPADRFAGATEAPLGGASAGEGTVALAVATSPSGLAPDTVYRYRAVASSFCSAEKAEKEEACETPGVDASFRTFPVEAPGLPDHRAYELVSPVQKNSSQVFPANPHIATCPGECKPGSPDESFPKQIAPDGDAVAYEGRAFDPEEGTSRENEYLARRTDSGWQNANPTPSRLFHGNDNGYEALSTDLSQAVLNQLSPALSPEAPLGYRNLYAQPTANPFSLTPFLTGEPQARSATEFRLSYAGASADLSRVFFAANDALTEATPGIAPPAPAVAATEFNLYEWHAGQLRLVNVLPGNAAAEPGAFGEASANAISADGSRVFWSSKAGQVYVREDGETTRAIETEGVPDPGKFLSASVDGTRVLLANGHLHDLGDEEPTVDLTNGKGGFQGLAGQSDDLSRLYFVDTEALTGENAEHKVPNEHGGKEDNLYAWHEGAVSFIATLVAADNGESLGIIRDWAPAPSDRTAEASPGGRYLAFLSGAQLTGYDNTGPCETDHVGGTVSAPCKEAFLYDSASGELLCASCNPSGQRPLGFTVLLTAMGQAYQPRYLTDEGRLYFDSRDSIVPTDTNEGVEDVYEWQPGGTGACQRQGGCVSLISAGTGIVDSNFFAVDSSGKNVFFTTADQLVPKDRDELIDLYDAREFGGIAADAEAIEPECQGEACQPQVVAPNDPTPGSSSFEGKGNVVEKASKTCPKGRARHHGRCVAKKHHRRATRSHKQTTKHNRGGAR